ncbi:hypothetical protein N7523_006075 [Penicillium sp. IBT 18751x]|nr:hypothetical protein N7523_006075 [Penicillium sp. IBT 18751x]
MGPFVDENELHDFLLSTASAHGFDTTAEYNKNLEQANEIRNYPHRITFTHGDLKAHNILVGDDGHLSGFLDWEPGCGEQGFPSKRHPLPLPPRSDGRFSCGCSRSVCFGFLSSRFHVNSYSIACQFPTSASGSTQQLPTSSALSTGASEGSNYLTSRLRLQRSGKIVGPYPIRPWELLEDAAPFVGVDETAVNLGYFDARCVRV